MMKLNADLHPAICTEKNCTYHQEVKTLKKTKSTEEVSIACMGYEERMTQLCINPSMVASQNHIHSLKTSPL
jgi:hypothetical protein